MLVVGSAGRLSLQLAVAVLVLNAVSLTLRLVNLGLGYSVVDADQPGWEHVPGLSALGVNFEANVPTWFTASLLVLCALACRGAGLLAAARGARRPRAWTLLALGCLCASIDELMKVHERVEPHVRQLLGQGGPRTVVVLVTAGLALVAVTGAVAGLLRGLPPPTRRLVGLAGAGYVGGAVVLDAVDSWLAELYTVDSVPYVLVSSTEELLEMLALTLLLFAVSRHAAELVRAPAPYPESVQEPVSR